MISLIAFHGVEETNLLIIHILKHGGLKDGRLILTGYVPPFSGVEKGR